MFRPTQDRVPRAADAVRPLRADPGRRHFLLRADPPPLFFRAGGKLSLLCIPVADGYFLFRSDGCVEFGGHVKVDLANVIGFEASLLTRLEVDAHRFQQR